MDLNKIHYFFKAVEYKNFTQAANACHIGQTTMSKYIAVLEQELQTQLFIREHRTLTLTKQGKQFYEGMKNIYASYQTLCQNIQQTNTLHIGMKTTDFTDFEILESFENVWIANYNCPGQIVITGLTNEVQLASLALKEAGAKRVVELKVSGPFHSLLLKPAGEALLKEMESMSFSTLQVPYVANATAEIVTDSKKISTFFAKGIYSSVRWQQSIEIMLENGVDTFVEIGPGKTLAGFMRKIAPKATVYNVSSFEDAIALEKCLSKA